MTDNELVRVARKLKKAAMKGQLERVKELYIPLLADAGTDEDCQSVAEAAAGRGHLHILQWLREQSPKFLKSGWIFFSAATAGHLHILQWLGKQPPVKVMGGAWIDIRSYMFAQAAGNGHLHIIQWLREQDPPCPWDVMACVRAARSGHLHIIRWLREQDPPCPWDTYPPPYGDSGTVSAAGEAGHLHVMRWLYESGFPWEQQYGTQCMQAAAGNGDLKALEWARSQHPPFVMDETVCEASWYMSFGAIGVLEWLRTQDPPCPWTSVQDSIHREPSSSRNI